MHWISTGFALLLALGIIVIGLMYLMNPRGAAQSFGLPLPEEGPNIAWWLRLKGVRDIVSGLVVLAVMVWGTPQILGIVLLVEAVTALGDMSLVLASRGSVKSAFGIHGVTAVVIIATALSLILGAN